MVNDTPDLDVDAPIPYSLTPLGVLTVAALRARDWGIVARTEDCWCGDEDCEHNGDARDSEGRS